MLSFIRRRLSLIKQWIIRLQTSETADLGAQSNNNLIIHSFYNNTHVLVYHKNDKDNDILKLPINLPLMFCLEELEEELNRFIFMKSYAPLFEKKYKKRRLLLYHNNPLLVGLIEKLLERDNYASYHIFCNSAETFNNMNFLAQKNKKIRLNEPESNLASMMRIIRNEYDEYYNDPDIRTSNDDTFIFFSKNNSITEICCAINWNNNCYICLPYNRFLYLFLIFLYRYYNKIDLLQYDKHYMLLKISKISSSGWLTIDQMIHKYYKKLINLKNLIYDIFFEGI